MDSSPKDSAQPSSISPDQPPLVPIDPAPPSPEMSNGNGAHPPEQPNALKVGALIEIGLCVFRITHINLKKKTMTLKLAGYVKQQPPPTEEQMLEAIKQMQAQGLKPPEPVAPPAPEPSILTPQGALKEVLGETNLGLKSSPKQVIVPHNFRKRNASE